MTPARMVVFRGGRPEWMILLVTVIVTWLSCGLLLLALSFPVEIFQNPVVHLAALGMGMMVGFSLISSRIPAAVRLDAHGLLGKSVDRKILYFPWQDIHEVIIRRYQKKRFLEIRARGEKEAMVLSWPSPAAKKRLKQMLQTRVPSDHPLMMVLDRPVE